MIGIIRPNDPPTYPPLVGPDRRRAMRSMLFADHGLVRTFFNTRSRLSDEMWRSAQPLPYQLRGAAALGIRTIVNLRGASDTAFYRLEEETCQQLGLTLVNFPLNSRTPPPRETMLAADTLFRTLAYPALMHCKSGVDRSGLMAALYLILRQGKSVAEARRQLSLRYGHLRYGSTGILDHILASYQAYDAATPMPFIDWLRTVYDPDEIRRSFRPRALAKAITDSVLRRE